MTGPRVHPALHAARRIARLLVLAVALAAPVPSLRSSVPGWTCARAAQPGWRAEFDDVCSKTQDAMTLPVEELKALIARCERLKPAIEQLDESQRKVFSRRLQGCRDLYQFVLDSKQGG